ncbi:class I SAM-dependent methyltransferase [Pandoraea pulmonicola]|uniref:SAM-dependent methyltransferase n=1 Tax=Pandoraea pulmonicola TaxID=93221 RepID=A0AAJ5D2D9_PANPU|nr:class I SAM-dependent methyltransferase [Pandoraea pulmonicola]AJC19369.1 SAM-dependent methyltransferase [Pandoraea pulmonicola]SUA92632.1 Tellurite resistance protein TehB [Pandoraea pulmonicola]
MADLQTEAAYEANAVRYSEDWLEQPSPDDMYALLMRYFVPGGRTVDVGCGNGRDAAWLAREGFDVVGYDNSPALVALARKTFPWVAFHVGKLPLLDNVTERFDNVVCETVLMHLPASEVPQAVDRLWTLVRPGGVLYLSWRVTEGADMRHKDGRLYSAFAPDVVRAALHDGVVLHEEDVTSASSGKRVCRLIVRRPA